MPRTCTVCSHRRRPDIDRAIVARELGYRDIAGRFRLARASLYRHACEHVPESLQRAHEVSDTAAAVDLNRELEACMTRVKLLLDACDEWLRDPDDPTRYSIDPHSEEVRVTYWEKGEDGRRQRRKKWLSELLDAVADEAPEIALVEVKRADPRLLILKAATTLGSQLELLARVLGKIKDAPLVSVLISPEWRALQHVILDVLADQPVIRTKLADRLAEVANAARN